MTGATALATRPAPRCPVCASAGVERYAGLRDRLFSAPGTWRMVRCDEPGCGLLWLDPAPRDETLAAAYAGYYTHAGPPPRRRPFRALREWIKEGHYSSRHGYRVRAGWLKRALAGAALGPATREALDAAILHLEARPGGRVVDVGCGDGGALERLGALGWAAEGVESDPAAVEAASARGLRVSAGSLEDLRLPPASRDAVTMSHVIEHLPDPVATLAECRRVLGPGGVVVVVTPNADGLGHERFGRDWRGLEPPRHLQVFGRGALERAVARAGLGIRSLRTTATAAAFIHAGSRRIRGEAGASPADAPARSFAREERARLRDDPWAGEELVLVAGAPLP